MSRFSLTLLLILILIIGGIVFLSTVNTEVAPKQVEKAMLNDSAPQ